MTSLKRLIGRMAVVLTCSLAVPAAMAQVFWGQTDTFQDGTVQNWDGFDYVNNPTGGPGGGGDMFLQVTSFGGSGPGSRLATYNDSQWTGNYVAAGVTGIAMDIRNQGAVTLSMRVCLFGVNGDRWTSTTPTMLTAGSGWQHVVFDLRESALTRVMGTGTYADTIGLVGQVMIRHDAGNPSAGGTSVVSQMGLDNIQAVPEPATLLALGGGLAFLLRRKNRA